MIDRISLAATAPGELRLPRQAHQDAPQASVFGEIFAHNAAQYSTLEAATALADFLGGKVVNVSENWGGGAKSPEYNIEFAAGKLLNAGLLAERFTKYGAEAALKMTEAEIGGAIHSPVSPLLTAAPVDAAPTPAAVIRGSSDPTRAAPPAAPGEARVSDLHSAATQFEAVVLTQLIRAARESGDGGWLNTDSKESANAVLEMAEEQLTQALSSTGGLGLADVITKALEPHGARRPKAD